MDFQIIAAKDGITYEDPDRVILEIVQFIHTNLPEQKDYCIGIASFGPLCLNK